MEPVTAVSALGALAMVVSSAFALCTWDRYRRRGRPHELAWTISLVMFALGSTAYWVAGALGWQGWSFRAFYLFGAILNVPYLALGTVYLLAGPRFGRPIQLGLGIAAGFCAGLVAVVPFRHALPLAGLPEGREVFGEAPRIMAAIGSGLGALVLIVGALWSAANLLRSKGRPSAGDDPVISPTRLAITNGLIAIGSIVLSLGGTFFAEADREIGFGVFLVCGIALLFSGFLVSGSAEPAGI